MKPMTAFWLLLLIPALGATLDVLWGPYASAYGYFGIISAIILSRVKS